MNMIPADEAKPLVVHYILETTGFTGPEYEKYLMKGRAFYDERDKRFCIELNGRRFYPNSLSHYRKLVMDHICLETPSVYGKLREANAISEKPF